MHIRSYEYRDWDSIYDIFERAKPDEIKGSCDLNAIELIQQDDETINLFEESTVFVAEINHKVVGFIGYSGNLISWLMVNPDCYRRGIAKKLLRFILVIIGSKAYVNIPKFNEKAKNLFANQKFKFVEEFEDEYNGYKIIYDKYALNPELSSWK